MAVRPKGRFTIDFPQDGASDFVAFPWFGLQMASPFGLPVLLLGGLELPAFLGVPNELSVIQAFTRRFHFGDRACLPHFVDQECGDVFLCARQIPDELQQADDFGHSLRPATIFRIPLESFGDLVNIGALFIGEVTLHQLEHFVQCSQPANGLLGQGRPVGHEHLVGLLDDRSVTAAVVAWCARLKANARHDPDAQVDVVRWVRVEQNKIVFLHIRLAACPFQSQRRI